MNMTTQIASICNKRPVGNQDVVLPSEKNFPIFTLLIGLLATIITLSSQLTSWLQFDRPAIIHGEIWRTLTGHLTHWSVSQLFWDVLMFLVLAGAIEWISRRRFLVYFAVSSLFVSLLVFIFLPEMKLYRGLSGIDSGLFMMLFVIFYQRNTSDKKLIHKIPYLFPGLLFICKISFEFFTARNVFAQTTDLFVPVPAAHLAGAFIGWLIVVLSYKECRI